MTIPLVGKAVVNDGLVLIEVDDILGSGTDRHRANMHKFYGNISLEKFASN